ncbi:hypothetical protein ACH5RR_032883 [Cinchona calisaya]|uniref:Uncharacterized protein n=1 Tax=Cinchona calisaya TaxID=153742 RepID=A0ABD2YJG1_9GENT
MQRSGDELISASAACQRSVKGSVPLPTLLGMRRYDCPCWKFDDRGMIHRCGELWLTWVCEEILVYTRLLFGCNLDPSNPIDSRELTIPLILDLWKTCMGKDLKQNGI